MYLRLTIYNVTIGACNEVQPRTIKGLNKNISENFGLFIHGAMTGGAKVCCNNPLILFGMQG